MTDMNILDLFLKASLLVKLIMLILIGFSIASWAIIIQRTRILNSAAREAEAFEDKFWSGIELSRLYQESQGRRDNLTGSEQIFYSGFKEFARLHRANSHAPEAIVEGASRAMRISMNRELETLETHIPFLGTVGSISPYIGLFGVLSWRTLARSHISGISALLLCQLPQTAQALIEPGFHGVQVGVGHPRNLLQLHVLEKAQSHHGLLLPVQALDGVIEIQPLPGVPGGRRGLQLPERLSEKVWKG